ncbi:MAG: DUF3071 domain-containing protein [Actinomycetota bacterium]|nr:MAG: DUF3071 domain-containing protein [Actinomycetota bacterium]
MRELTYVRLTDDGAGLLLTAADGDGQEYRVALDERLSATLRRDRNRAAQPVTEPLRPRDIQARIRAGATAEEVAELAGLPVERVRRYEGPVLAEREWVAGQARSCVLRRPEGAVALEDVVTARLQQRGVDPEDVRWDAWRRDDGLWTVLVAYPAAQGDRVATWVYDTAGRTLVAEDDDGRWLTEDPAADEDRRHLVAVPAATDEPPLLDPDLLAPWTSPITEAPPEQAAETGAAYDVPADPAEAGATHDTVPVARRRAARKAKRSSVPTWDEILFGSGRPDE